MAKSKLLVTLMLAFVISSGAQVGLEADSYEDTRLTPADVGLNSSVQDNLSSSMDNAPTPEPRTDEIARLEFVEGAMYLLTAWISFFAGWSYNHPGVAESVLVNAPLLLIGLISAKYVAHACLIVHVIVDDYRRD